MPLCMSTCITFLLSYPEHYMIVFGFLIVQNMCPYFVPMRGDTHLGIPQRTRTKADIVSSDSWRHASSILNLTDTNQC